MAIVLNGKKLAEARLNGKKLKEAWINGHRVFPDPMLNVQPARVDFTANGGSNGFKIWSNEAWTITCNTNPTPFIISKYTGSGNDIINVTVPKNPASPNQRTLTIRTTSGLEKTVVLFQEAETYGNTKTIKVTWNITGNSNIKVSGHLNLGSGVAVVNITGLTGTQNVALSNVSSSDKLNLMFNGLQVTAPGAVSLKLTIKVKANGSGEQTFTATGTKGGSDIFTFSPSSFSTAILLQNVTEINLTIL